MAGRIGLALSQQRAVAIEQFELHAGLRLATFQRLGEHVETVAIAMRGQADITQGKQRRRLRVAVAAGLTHHRQVHARLLERLQAGDGQQQGFTGVARRVEVEAPAIDQIGHRQQFARLPGIQVAGPAPAGQETRQRLGLDTEELDVDLVDVQRDDRQTFGQAGRQQRTAAGEADAGLQVAGFEAADVLFGEFAAIDRRQASIDGQHQFALRLQVAQAQLAEVVGQFPGAVDLAGSTVDQVQALGEGLVGVQRDGEGHRQRTGAVELHLGDVDHLQLAPGVALGQRVAVDRWLGRLWLLRSRRARGHRGRGLGGITGAEQGQQHGQKQSFVRHCGLRNQGRRDRQL